MSVDPGDLDGFWQDFPDTSTPLTASTLNAWGGAVKAALVGAQEAQSAAEDAAAEAADSASAPTDAVVAGLLATPTSDTRESLDGLTAAERATSDASYLTRSPVTAALERSHMISYGHSFLAETGLGDVNNYWARRLAAHYGMVYPTATAANDLKRAVGGSLATDAAIRTIGTTEPWEAGTKAFAVVQCLINTARKWGNTVESQRAARHALRAICATISSSQRIESASFTFSTAWTTGSGSEWSGGNYHNTSGAGFYAQYVVPQRGCWLLLAARKAGLATATTTVTDVTAGTTLLTFTNVDQAPSDLSQNYVPMAVPLNVAPGTTVRVTATTGNTVLDALLVPSPKPVPILLMKEPYLANYALSTSFPNGSDAVIDAFNALIDEVAAEFPNAIVADPNAAGYWDKNTHILADGVHPNTAGHEALFLTARDAIDAQLPALMVMQSARVAFGLV